MLSASLREHETFWPAMLHTQPAPAAAVGVRPAGTESLIVTGLEVGPPPMFDTVSRYRAPTCPCKKLPACTLEIVRSGTAMTVVDPTSHCCRR